jgi:amino acid transporter
MAFATFFVTIANTTGNAIAFARFVMIAVLPTETRLEALDSKVVKLVAINIVSVVCLLHYFSHNLGRFLNKLLAIYKFCLLLAVMIAGFCATRAKNGGFDKDIPQNPKNQLGGIVLVLYSFTGWENANYVCRL